jgi:MFS family permease
MRAQTAWLGEFLALNRNVSILLAVLVLISTGEELWLRFIPKYLEVLGASVFVIGLFDALKTLFAAIYAYPGGIVVDRYGHRKALVVFTALSVGGYAIALLVTHWSGVLAGMFLFLAWRNLSLPASLSLVASSLPSHKHTMGIGVQSLVRRLPLLVGPVIGGLLIDRMGIVGGVRTGFAVSLVLALVALLLQQQIREAVPAVVARGQRFWHLLAGLNPTLRWLLFSDILIRFCERIHFAWVVIYAMNDLGMTGTQMGILVAVEVGAAVACYLPASFLADRFGREPFVIGTFVLFTLSPVTLLFADSFAGLLLAFAVRGLREFGEPARKTLIVQHSPDSQRGQVVGIYYLVRDTLASLGSILGAALWVFGSRVNFLSAALFGAVGTAAYLSASLRTPEDRVRSG